jgi:hypothetical protein
MIKDGYFTEIQWLCRKKYTTPPLVSDANPTYAAFCQSEGISHEVVNLSKGLRVNGTFHAQNVNAYHNRFKE